MKYLLQLALLPLALLALLAIPEPVEANGRLPIRAAASVNPFRYGPGSQFRNRVFFNRPALGFNFGYRARVGPFVAPFVAPYYRQRIIAPINYSYNYYSQPLYTQPLMANLGTGCQGYSQQLIQPELPPTPLPQQPVPVPVPQGGCGGSLGFHYGLGATSGFSYGSSLRLRSGFGY